MAINPSLSPQIVVSKVCAKPSSDNKFLNHRASCVALDKAIYLASVVDIAVIDCFLRNQVIMLPAIIKTYPVIDFKSFMLPKLALA
jgi:hypothetical protein